MSATAERLRAAAEQRDGAVIGDIYVIHFDTPYRHAKHYTGWAHAGQLEARLEAHRRGDRKAARLMQVIHEAGITWRVATIIRGVDRKYERALKESGGATRRCLICNPNYRGFGAGEGSA